MACPNGVICPIIQGHLNGLSNIGEFAHLQEYTHFCPFYEEKCPHINNRWEKNHHLLRHLCGMGDQCPLIKDTDVYTFNFHINNYYHRCPMEDNCLLISDRFHQASYSHPGSISDEIKGFCDSCGYYLENIQKMGCNKYTCSKCKREGRCCNLCYSISNNALESKDSLEPEPEPELNERVEETKEEEECIICMDALLNGSQSTLPCMHTFHGDCLDRWFAVSRREVCPLCNIDVAILKERQRDFERSHGINI